MRDSTNITICCVLSNMVMKRTSTRGGGGACVSGHFFRCHAQKQRPFWLRCSAVLPVSTWAQSLMIQKRNDLINYSFFFGKLQMSRDTVNLAELKSMIGVQLVSTDNIYSRSVAKNSPFLRRVLILIEVRIKPQFQEISFKKKSVTLNNHS